MRLLYTVVHLTVRDILRLEKPFQEEAAQLVLSGRPTSDYTSPRRAAHLHLTDVKTQGVPVDVFGDAIMAVHTHNSRDWVPSKPSYVVAYWYLHRHDAIRKHNSGELNIGLGEVTADVVALLLNPATSLYHWCGWMTGVVFTIKDQKCRGKGTLKWFKRPGAMNVNGQLEMYIRPPHLRCFENEVGGWKGDVKAHSAVKAASFLRIHLAMHIPWPEFSAGGATALFQHGLDPGGNYLGELWVTNITPAVSSLIVERAQRFFRSRDAVTCPLYGRNVYRRHARIALELCGREKKICADLERIDNFLAGNDADNRTLPLEGCVMINSAMLHVCMFEGNGQMCVPWRSNVNGGEHMKLNPRALGPLMLDVEPLDDVELEAPPDENTTSTDDCQEEPSTECKDHQDILREHLTEDGFFATGPGDSGSQAGQREENSTNATADEQTLYEHTRTLRASKQIRKQDIDVGYENVSFDHLTTVEKENAVADDIGATQSMDPAQSDCNGMWTAGIGNIHTELNADDIAEAIAATLKFKRSKKKDVNKTPRATGLYHQLGHDQLLAGALVMDLVAKCIAAFALDPKSIARVQTLLLHGCPGVGKSFLLDNIIERIEALYRGLVEQHASATTHTTKDNIKGDFCIQTLAGLMKRGATPEARYASSLTAMKTHLSATLTWLLVIYIDEYTQAQAIEAAFVIRNCLGLNRPVLIIYLGDPGQMGAIGGAGVHKVGFAQEDLSSVREIRVESEKAFIGTSEEVLGALKWWMTHQMHVFQLHENNRFLSPHNRQREKQVAGSHAHDQWVYSHVLAEFARGWLSELGIYWVTHSISEAGQRERLKRQWAAEFTRVCVADTCTRMGVADRENQDAYAATALAGWMKDPLARSVCNSNWRCAQMNLEHCVAQGLTSILVAPIIDEKEKKKKDDEEDTEADIVSSADIDPGTFGHPVGNTNDTVKGVTGRMVFTINGVRRMRGSNAGGIVGLANGAEGIARCVWYSPGESPPQLFSAAFVEFPNLAVRKDGVCPIPSSVLRKLRTCPGFHCDNENKLVCLVPAKVHRRQKECRGCVPQTEESCARTNEAMLGLTVKGLLRVDMGTGQHTMSADYVVLSRTLNVHRYIVLPFSETRLRSGMLPKTVRNALSGRNAHIDMLSKREESTMKLLKHIIHTATPDVRARKLLTASLNERAAAAQTRVLSAAKWAQLVEMFDAGSLDAHEALGLNADITCACKHSCRTEELQVWMQKWVVARPPPNNPNNTQEEGAGSPGVRAPHHGQSHSAAAAGLWSAGQLPKPWDDVDVATNVPAAAAAFGPAGDPTTCTPLPDPRSSNTTPQVPPVLERHGGRFKLQPRAPPSPVQLNFGQSDCKEEPGARKLKGIQNYSGSDCFLIVVVQALICVPALYTSLLRSPAAGRVTPALAHPELPQSFGLLTMLREALLALAQAQAAASNDATIQRNMTTLFEAWRALNLDVGAVQDGFGDALQAFSILLSTRIEGADLSAFETHGTRVQLGTVHDLVHAYTMVPFGWCCNCKRAIPYPPLCDQHPYIQLTVHETMREENGTYKLQNVLDQMFLQPAEHSIPVYAEGSVCATCQKCMIVNGQYLALPPKGEGSTAPLFPPVLAIAYPRRKHVRDQEGGETRIIVDRTPVQFDATLWPTPHWFKNCTQRNNPQQHEQAVPPVYHLRAVVCHANAHYVCYGPKTPSETNFRPVEDWVRANDNEIEHVPASFWEQRHVQERAVIWLYERQPPPPTDRKRKESSRSADGEDGQSMPPKKSTKRS
jgi:hypothetical protein